jgi:hypothetical protein
MLFRFQDSSLPHSDGRKLAVKRSCFNTALRSSEIVPFRYRREKLEDVCNAHELKLFVYHWTRARNIGYPLSTPLSEMQLQFVAINA